MNTKAILLEEINRMREIMKLPLITEAAGGGVYGVIDNILSKLSKGASDFSDEERRLLDDIFNGSPTIKNQFTDLASALKLSDDFLDALIKNSDEVTTAIKSTAKKYADNVIAKMSSTTDAVVKQTFSKMNNELRVALKKLDTATFDVMDEAELAIIKNEIVNARKGLTNVDPDVNKLLDDVENAIDLKKAEKGITADDVTSALKPSVLGKTIEEIDTSVTKIIDDFTTDATFNASLKSKYSKLTEEEKLKMKNLVDNMTDEQADELEKGILSVCGLKESFRNNKRLINEARSGWEKFCAGAEQSKKVASAGIKWSIAVAAIILIFTGLSYALDLGEYIRNFFDRITPDMPNDNPDDDNIDISDPDKM